jgi:hypothetical protein
MVFTHLGKGRALKNPHITSKAGYFLAAGEALRREFNTDLKKEGRRWRLIVNEQIVQVKSRRSGDWPFDDPERELRGDAQFMIFVDLGAGKDPLYYVMKQAELREIMASKHQNWLNTQVDGKRPRTPESKQQSLRTSDVEAYLGQWDLLQGNESRG